MIGPLVFAELFAGAGGLSMGLERAGWTCAFHVEIADAPRAILKHRWPATPLYRDVVALVRRAPDSARVDSGIGDGHARGVELRGLDRRYRGGLRR